MEYNLGSAPRRLSSLDLKALHCPSCHSPTCHLPPVCWLASPILKPPPVLGPLQPEPQNCLISWGHATGPLYLTPRLSWATVQSLSLCSSLSSKTLLTPSLDVAHTVQLSLQVCPQSLCTPATGLPSPPQGHTRSVPSTQGTLPLDSSIPLSEPSFKPHLLHEVLSDHPPPSHFLVHFLHSTDHDLQPLCRLSISIRLHCGLHNPIRVCLHLTERRTH